MRNINKIFSYDLRISEMFESFLPSSNLLPPLDLLIRTSGERRVSNFFLWEVAYAELHFTEKMWPEFGKEDLLEALRDYASRERRFGLTGQQVQPEPSSEPVSQPLAEHDPEDAESVHAVPRAGSDG